MKAQTAAIKYAYLLSLAISTGDDPEADTKTDQNMGHMLKDTNLKQKLEIKEKARVEIPVQADSVCSDCSTNITQKVVQYVSV